MRHRSVCEVVNALKVGKLETVEEIKELLHRFNEAFYPPLKERLDLDAYSGKLHEKAIVLVAEGGVGFVVVYANDKELQTAYIPFIGVLPSAQSQGVGKSLLNASMDCSRANGMTKIRLEVRMDNERARRFYEGNGFKYNGEASEESLYMAREL